MCSLRCKDVFWSSDSNRHQIIKHLGAEARVPGRFYLMTFITPDHLISSRFFTGFGDKFQGIRRLFLFLVLRYSHLWSRSRTVRV